MKQKLSLSPKLMIKTNTMYLLTSYHSYAVTSDYPRYIFYKFVESEKKTYFIFFFNSVSNSRKMIKELLTYCNYREKFLQEKTRHVLLRQVKRNVVF